MVASGVPPSARDAAIAHLRKLFMRLPMLDEQKADVYARKLESEAFEASATKQDWANSLREKESMLKKRIDRAVALQHDAAAVGPTTTTAAAPAGASGPSALPPQPSTYAGAPNAPHTYEAQNAGPSTVPLMPWSAVLPHVQNTVGMLSPSAVPNGGNGRPRQEMRHEAHPSIQQQHHHNAPVHMYNAAPIMQQAASWNRGHQQVHPYLLTTPPMHPNIQQGGNPTHLVHSAVQYHQHPYLTTAPAPGHQQHYTIQPSGMVHGGLPALTLTGNVGDVSGRHAGGAAVPQDDNPLAKFRKLQAWSRENLLVDAKRVLAAYEAHLKDGQTALKSNKNVGMLNKAVYLMELEDPAVLGAGIDAALVNKFKRVLETVAQSVQKLRDVEKQRSQLKMDGAAAQEQKGTPASSQTQLGLDCPPPACDKVNGETLHGGNYTRASTEEATSARDANAPQSVYTSASERLLAALKKRKAGPIECGTAILEMLKQRKKSARGIFPLPQLRV